MLGSVASVIYSQHSVEEHLALGVQIQCLGSETRHACMGMRLLEVTAVTHTLMIKKYIYIAHNVTIYVGLLFLCLQIICNCKRYQVQQHDKVHNTMHVSYSSMATWKFSCQLLMGVAAAVPSLLAVAYTADGARGGAAAVPSADGGGTAAVPSPDCAPATDGNGAVVLKCQYFLPLSLCAMHVCIQRVGYEICDPLVIQ